MWCISHVFESVVGQLGWQCCSNFKTNRPDPGVFGGEFRTFSSHMGWPRFGGVFLILSAWTEEPVCATAESLAHLKLKIQTPYKIRSTGWEDFVGSTQHLACTVED